LSGEVDLGFWTRISWVQVTFVWRVDRAVQAPAFLGTSLRGALGYRAKAAWCHKRPRCERTCHEPASCRFAQWYGETDAAGDLRPYVLKPPVPAEPRRIAYGGAVEEPFLTGEPEWRDSAARLSCESDLIYEEGAEIRWDLVLLGDAAAGLPALIAECAAAGLEWRQGFLTLKRVEDAASSGHTVWDGALLGWWGAPRTRCLDELSRGGPVHRLRVVLLTPVRIKSAGGKHVCLSETEMTAMLFEKCLVRTVQLHNALLPTAQRLPRLDLPPRQWRVSAHRLFHYVLPRTSLQQGRDMQYDGLVGWIEYSGDLTEMAALVRAAGVLHIGQKATAGLGWVVSFEN